MPGRKVRRLSESATDGGMTLWEALHRYLNEENAATRADVLLRFNNDDEAVVKGILNDLVESGLVSRTGRGDGTVYRAMRNGTMPWANADRYTPPKNA